MKSLTTLEPNFSREDKLKGIEAWAEEARHSLLDFCGFTYPRYMDPPHIRAIAAKLEAVERGDIKKLIITAPPRHGKSVLVSQQFPAFYLGRNPDKRIILSSYAASLVYSFSRQIRDLFEEIKFKIIFGLSTAENARAVGAWDIKKNKGGVIATGVGGPITGFGADLFIIDDPVKNRQEAESKVQREKVWSWYKSVVRTRLEPGAAIIIMMARWHKEDLIGKLLEGDDSEIEELDEVVGGDWEVVDFPAVAYKDDSLGRKEGEALWPARFDEKELASLKYDVKEQAWFSLYQGRPQNPSGQLVQRNWVQWYVDTPPDCIRGGGIDTATSSQTLADNMSLVDVCKDSKGFLYCDDVFCEKISVSGFANHVSAQHKVKKYRKVRLESNNAGEAVKQRIDEVSREDGNSVPVKAIQTTTDKTIRLMEFQHLIENGTLKFKKGNAKVAALVDHLVEFPQAIDDDVDGLGFAIKAALEKDNISTMSM